MQKTFTWDEQHRFQDDPCGCALCRKIQKAVNSRNQGEKLLSWYRLLEAMANSGQVRAEHA